MVKYYCNRCGEEVKTNLLKIATVDGANDKHNYHLCRKCTKEFLEFIKLQRPKAIAPKLEKAESREVVEKEPAFVREVRQAEMNMECAQDTTPIVENTKAEDTTPKTTEDEKPDDSILNENNEIVAEIPTKKPTGRQSKYLTDYNKTFIQKHRKDMSPIELSRKLGIPYQNVYQYIRSISNRYIPDIDMSVDAMGKCLALRRAGWSVKDIASEIDRSQEEVIAVLRVNNL